MAMVPALQFTYWQWLSLTLAAPVVVWGAWPFHRAAWTNLRHGAATMDTLISLGTLAAFGWSLYALFFGTAGAPGHDPPVRADHRAQRRRGQHLPRGRRRRHHVHPRRPLLRGPLQAPRRRRAAGPARARRQGRRRAARRRASSGSRSPSSLVGDLFVVRPGEKIATDGVGRRRASSAVDASHAHRRVGAGRGRPGDAVVGATVNAGGRLVVRATRVGADTQLAQMARLVEDAQNGKAEVQRLADRISGVFVPVVIALAVGHPRLLARHRRRPRRRRSPPPSPC